jgi:hypothetical protein
MYMHHSHAAKVAYLGRTAFPCSLSQRVHDYWPGHRCGWSDEQVSELCSIHASPRLLDSALTSSPEVNP